MAIINRKQQLGQFMTTKYQYILQGMKIPENVKHIIEPMTGKGDLIEFIDTEKYILFQNSDEKSEYIIELYDIDPQSDAIIQRDTILNPPNYKNKFLITNPPYLARNKSLNKELYNLYNQNDLYKCLILELIKQGSPYGILIIPVNFWSSIRKNDIELREMFINKYNILRLNIFEEQVFDDTTITICSFQYELKKIKKEQEINIHIYPIMKNLIGELNKDNNFMLGGSVYNLNTSKYKIYRLTKENKEKKNTNLLVKCIDDNINNKIAMDFVSDDKIFIDNTPNLSARTYATLIIEPAISIDDQKILKNHFNDFLNEWRNEYHSLFLANYRESNDIARKRISFDLIYLITGNILDVMNY
jgi:hypothetical protein